MDIEQYRCFIMVADCGSVTEAARRLNTTQPAVSMKIKRMAAELGCELFVKVTGSQSMQLTQTGAIVYNNAIKMCALEDDMRGRLLENQNGMRGILHLQLLPWEKEEMIYSILKGFHELYPNIKLDLYDTSPGVDSHAYIEYEIKLLSSEELDEYQKSHDIIRLGVCPVYLVCSKDNPWINADVTSIRVEDLCNIPLVFMDASFSRKIAGELAKFKGKPNIVGYSHYRGGALYMARAGMCGAIVGHDDDKRYYPDLRFIPIENYTQGYYHVVGKPQGKELSPVLNCFVEYISKRSKDKYFVNYKSDYTLVK